MLNKISDITKTYAKKTTRFIGKHYNSGLCLCGGASLGLLPYFLQDEIDTKKAIACGVIGVTLFSAGFYGHYQKGKKILKRFINRAGFNEQLMEFCYANQEIHKLTKNIAKKLGRSEEFEDNFNSYKATIDPDEMTELQKSIEKMSPKELEKYLFHDK